MSSVWEHAHVSMGHPERELRLTFEAGTTAKRAQYAAAGIPGYLVVHFGKDWAKISEIEEYRLDWPGRRYVAGAAHRRALILDDPLRLTVTFEDLQGPEAGRTLHDHALLCI